MSGMAKPLEQTSILMDSSSKPAINISHPAQSCPCAAVLLGRLPSDETPGVSSLGCALVAVRACLWVLLCCVHPIPFLTPYLPYPTVVPSVRYTSSTLSCL
jgi:hypothetical protein